MAWEDYLMMSPATEQEVTALEERLRRHLPRDLREAIKSLQGKSPETFELVLPGGRKPAFDCLFHCDPSGDWSYEISAMARVIEEEDQRLDLVPFACGGHVLYCLDYRDPSVSVVFVDRDVAADDPRSRLRIASSFTEFLRIAIPD
jgi:hypothetical protein